MNDAAVSQLRSWQADLALVLGSGLGSIVPAPAASISYSEFAGLPAAKVPGHAGKFSFAEICGRKIIFAQGRSHLYEGLGASEVTAGVRLLAEVGVRTIIFTNAAGALNQEFRPGDWMLITDHLNLTGASPLERAHFLDLTCAYSPVPAEKFRASARAHSITLREGIYAALRGPQYETPAEVRMLQRLGADAVGMSTVLEVIQARALGMEVAALSCLTNLAAGLSHSAPSHEEVLACGRAAAAIFAKLLPAVVAR